MSLNHTHPGSAPLRVLMDGDARLREGLGTRVKLHQGSQVGRGGLLRAGLLVEVGKPRAHGEGGEGEERLVVWQQPHGGLRGHCLRQARDGGEEGEGAVLHEAPQDGGDALAVVAAAQLAREHPRERRRVCLQREELRHPEQTAPLLRRQQIHLLVTPPSSTHKCVQLNELLVVRRLAPHILRSTPHFVSTRATCSTHSSNRPSRPGSSSSSAALSTSESDRDPLAWRKASMALAVASSCSSTSREAARFSATLAGREEGWYCQRRAARRWMRTEASQSLWVRDGSGGTGGGRRGGRGG